MKKKASQQNKLNGDTPATQHDLALWGGELARQLDGKASKEDLKAVENRLDGIDNRLDGMEDRVAARVVVMMQAWIEQLLANRDAAHHDQLDIAMEKKDAPPTWKSIPRRLKVVEMDVAKIKDKLA